MPMETRLDLTTSPPPPRETTTATTRLSTSPRSSLPPVLDISTSARLGVTPHRLSLPAELACLQLFRFIYARGLARGPRSAPRWWPQPASPDTPTAYNS